MTQQIKMPPRYTNAVFAVWDNETAFLSVMFNVDSVEVSISTLLYNLTPNNYQVNRIF